MSAARFDRQLPLFGSEGQRRLRAARVAIVGVGGTGSIVIPQLALLGVGHLSIIDHDQIEETNRNRHMCARGADPIPGTMKVDTATAGSPRATDPLRVSASPPSAPLPLSPSAPSLSSPSDSWRSSSSLSSLLPPPTLTDEILDDLAVPQFSLAIVAQKHGLTLSGMLTWLNLPETREVLALRESAAYAHARHVAALNIGHAVETVASIVRDYNTTRPEREAQDRKTPGSAHRAATNARKAAWLLLQFARIVPVNEADLRRATGCLPASAKNTTSNSVACS
jgi:hypothetical protein